MKSSLDTQGSFTPKDRERPNGQWLFTEQIKLIYSNALPSTISIFVVTLLAAFGLSGVLGAWILYGWACYMLIVAALRLALFYCFKRHFKESRIRLWAVLIILSAASAGIGWAGVSLFAHVVTDNLYRVVVVMIVIGIIAGTVPVLSAVPSAFFSASLPPAITLIGVIAQWNMEAKGLLMSTLVIYTILIIRTAKNTHGILLQTLHLQKERESLISGLNDEIGQRKQAQQQLEQHKKQLEETVAERTHQLKESNLELEQEIAIRVRSEQELRDKKTRLEHVAFHDALTNLPNRILLADRLKKNMALSQRNDQTLAVAYLDLDGFKSINDRHGHKVGDQFLITLGRRMGNSLRESDTLARLGGDEFVAVLVGLSEKQDSIKLLNRMLAIAAQPIHVDKLILQASASIGVVFYPQTVEVDADQLLRQADQAMYKAKLLGKNRYYFFEPDKDRFISVQHESIERIRRGLDNDEFCLFYQPKVNMRTGEIIGAEALIRWRHPERGMLLPNHFLPLIENEPLAVYLDRWVIETSLKQIQLWQIEGFGYRISVNVGAAFLQQTDFVEQLHELLSRYPDVNPELLELEVLETSALEDLAQISQVMEICSEMGVAFAIDDFGTGYSSLTYLKQLPAEYLKIDRSFVRDMLEDPDDLAILEGVLGLASAFRRKAIAEGVETVEHGAFLLQLGCDLAQGYAIARPMPAEEFPLWTTEWRPDISWADQQRISRDDLPLLFASVEHRAWASNIEKCLDEEQVASKIPDRGTCRFGEWLRQSGKARYGRIERFALIEQLHEQIHDLTEEICQAGENIAPKREPLELEKLLSLHQQLLAEVHDLPHASQITRH